MNKIKSVLSILGLLGGAAKYFTKSNAVFGKFTDIVKALEAINQGILECREKKEAEQKKLQDKVLKIDAEKQALEIQMNANKNLALNIDEFLYGRKDK
jgi:hypothetical protein